MTTTEEELGFSKEFTQCNNKVRNEWEAGRKAARNVSKYLNELVAVIHNEQPDWSIKKIARQIWIANEDLEGFSTNTIYNNLSDENRQLIDKSHSSNTSRNNVLEQSDSTLSPNVIEESSSSRTLPTAYTIKEAESSTATDLDDQITQTAQQEQEEQEEEPAEIYDKQFVDRLIKENAKLVDSFTFEYDLEVKDQILPLKVIVYPDKQTGVVRLRKK